MIDSVSTIPRVEKYLFRAVEDMVPTKNILSVVKDEELVEKAKSRLHAVVENNSHGPLKYIETYDNYIYMLKQTTETRIKKFVGKRDKTLRDFRKEIEILKNLINEIALLPIVIPMHLFSLDCNRVNGVNIIYSIFVYDYQN